MFKSLHFKSFLLFMLAMFMGGVNSAWAAYKQNVSNVTTSFSATGNVTSNFTQSGDFTAATWSLDVTWKNGTSWQQMNSSKGSQVGSGSKPASSIILTGTNIPGTIKSVKVNSSVASGGTTTVGVEVGSTTFQCNNANTATLQTSAADYTFTGEASGDVVLTWTQPSTSKAIYIKSVTITYEESDPSDTRAATTVTIDASGITNTNVFNGTAAGSLSATVKAGEAAVDGASVTWSSETESVATIDATGAVTLVGAGSTVITAYYAGDDTNYKPSTNTYELTVTNIDPNAPGTENNPYTVAQAIENTPSSGTSDNVYIKGIVSKFYDTDIVSDGTNYRYYISDDGTETNQLLVYKGKGLNNVTFSSADDLQIGDEVVILGGLTTYKNEPEVAANNYIVSQTQKELSSITLSGDYTTSFVEGSEFNHDGVVVTATYSDQTTADVTSQAEFSTPDMTQVGEQTVTVSYGGKSTSYNITITEAPTHTATFSVNGTTSTEDFKEGAAITFPSVTAPTGYTFMGWTETAISTTQETAPADLTSSATMGNDDVKYYAVFATAQGTGGAPSLTKMVSGDTFTDGDKVVIVADVDETTSYGLYQQTISNSYVMNFVFDNSVTTIAADDKNYLTVSSGSDGKWKLGDDTNGYLYNSSSNNLAVSTENATEWTLEDNEDGTFSLMGARYLSCRTDLSGDNANRWRMAGSSPSGVYDLAIYKFVDGNTSYSGYCTTVPEAVEVIITSAGAASFSSKYALDFSKVEGLKAYKATSKSDSYVHLDEVEQVPAGAGVIVKGAEGTYNVPVATGDVAALDGNLLVGTAEATYTVGDDYGKVFKYVKRTSDDVVGFQKAKADWTCQIGHAYLMLPTPSAREYLNIFDEEPIDDVATGINSIDNSQLTIDNDAPAYNLAGQKVGKGYKGIVVKNGKKYVK